MTNVFDPFEQRVDQKIDSVVEWILKWKNEINGHQVRNEIVVGDGSAQPAAATAVAAAVAVAAAIAVAAATVAAAELQGPERKK